MFLFVRCRQHETLSWTVCGFVAGADCVRAGNLMTLNVKVLAVRSRYKLPPLRGTQDSEITLQRSPTHKWRIKLLRCVQVKVEDVCWNHVIESNDILRYKRNAILLHSPYTLKHKNIINIHIRIKHFLTERNNIIQTTCSSAKASVCLPLKTHLNLAFLSPEQINYLYLIVLGH